MKSELGLEMPEMMLRAAKAAGFGAGLSRREFLFLSAGAVTGLAALNIGRVWGADAPIIIIDNAKGLLLADPSRCVGCLRCELACTEFNDGRAQPSLARIKVGRNINFGPEGPVRRGSDAGRLGKRPVHSGHLPTVPSSRALRHSLSRERHQGRPGNRRPHRGHVRMRRLPPVPASMSLEHDQLR